jgi:hypothetical protein
MYPDYAGSGTNAVAVSGISLDCYECKAEILADINYDGYGTYEAQCSKCGNKQKFKYGED